MKLGYSTWGMPTVPIDVIIPHLARLGYDGVELTVIPGYSIGLDTLGPAERQRILGLLRQYDLALPAIAGHRSLMAEDVDEHTENMRRLKGTVDLAVDWAMDGQPPRHRHNPASHRCCIGRFCAGYRPDRKGRQRYSGGDA